MSDGRRGRRAHGGVLKREGPCPRRRPGARRGPDRQHVRDPRPCRAAGNRPDRSAQPAQARTQERPARRRDVAKELKEGAPRPRARRLRRRSRRVSSPARSPGSRRRRRAGSRPGSTRSENYEDLEPYRIERCAAWITIMRGCDKFCSYCIVPFTRGREKCRSRRDPRRGAPRGRRRSQEVTLLGQNVNSYRSAAGISRICWRPWRRLRVSTGSVHDQSSDQDFTRRLVDTIAAHPTICDHVLPVQSGSDRILAAMQREHGGVVSRAGRHAARGDPGCALSTDIIVGFPGETERTSGHVRSHGRGAVQLRLHLHLLSSTPYAGGVHRRCAGSSRDRGRSSRTPQRPAARNRNRIPPRQGGDHPVRARPGRGAAGEAAGWTEQRETVVIDGDPDLVGSIVRPDHGTARDHVARLDRAACPAWSDLPRAARAGGVMRAVKIAAIVGALLAVILLVLFALANRGQPIALSFGVWAWQGMRSTRSTPASAWGSS